LIEPRRDAYGAEADTSHLADYLELLALSGQPLKEADLADYLADSTWVVRSRELFVSPQPTDEPTEDEDEGGPQPSPSEIAAGDVFAFVAERADALGALYPFVIEGSALTVVDPLADIHLPYLALLSITVAHHYKVDTAHEVERVFERIVADVMTARGLATVDTGAAGRGQGNFRQLVEKVGEAIELVPAPEAASSRRYANEEGVDTVSHLSWGDQRTGHWIFLGQATCARSNEWARKIKEPDPRQWGPLLSSVVDPVAYLAVPHHVESHHLLNISQATGRLVLDRIRLVRYLGALTADQEAVLRAVRAQPVYSPVA
jgi:hypothetical protein